jgi:hypothetical protein
MSTKSGTAISKSRTANAGGPLLDLENNAVLIRQEYAGSKRGPYDLYNEVLEESRHLFQQVIELKHQSTRTKISR